jgi:hypothetical protein
MTECEIKTSELKSLAYICLIGLFDTAAFTLLFWDQGPEYLAFSWLAMSMLGLFFGILWGRLYERNGQRLTWF